MQTINFFTTPTKEYDFPNKVMCVCECYIYAKSMHSYLLTWRNCRLKQLKDRSHNAQNRRSDETASHIFETYNDSVRPHGCHIYNTAAEISMEKCVPVPLNTTGYHAENVCYIVVISDQVLSYPFRRQIIYNKHMYNNNI